MAEDDRISRRSTLEGLGALGAATFLAPSASRGEGNVAGIADSGMDGVRGEIWRKVLQTPFIDTHEHLIEEKARLSGTTHGRVRSDDWSMVLSHYLDSDMIAAGMPDAEFKRFFSPEVKAIDKWPLLKPFWAAIKNTGYGQAVRIAMKVLYGVDDLSDGTIGQVQAGYEKVRRPGFYKHILRDLSGIESTQVNCLERPFMKSAQPTLLMQDLSIVGMFQGPAFDVFGGPAGINVASLSDWHRVIDWWFHEYGPYAVAVKSQNAYARDIDYQQTPAEKVEAVFKKVHKKEPHTAEERKSLEDHLFFYAVKKATEADLPVKLHTGYYAGQNYMPLSRLINNPGSVTALCRAVPSTRFVFMHICYPYYEEMISVAKHYTNAFIDMCWAWIINPVAAKDFLKKYLVAAPANKILTFGGDYIPVEPVLGHAMIARRGITLALAELVEEGWMSLGDAMSVIDPIMHGNARKIFRLDAKTKALEHAPWTTQAG